MKALIPIDQDHLGGPYAIIDDDRLSLRGDRGKYVVCEFSSLPGEVAWFFPMELMFCQRQHDPNVVKVLRKATRDEYQLFRVPIWIQDEHTLECCDQQMYFVGQVDDSYLYMERPADAKLWWHDFASFYVFTCSQCLGCKVIGQQI
jgi:hypothetical protein